MKALASDFEVNGVSAIDTVRREDPAKYLSVIASVLPKDIDITNYDEMSEEQIAGIIAALRAAVAAGVTGVIRIEGEAAGGEEQAKGILPLH